jgi:hypothetical protein
MTGGAFSMPPPNPPCERTVQGWRPQTKPVASTINCARCFPPTHLLGDHGAGVGDEINANGEKRRDGHGDALVNLPTHTPHVASVN